MSKCGTYVVPPGFQIRSGGPTGPVDCTAWSTRDVVGQATCGKKIPSGRLIRLQSDEPIPDKRSPGLSLAQVAAVALDEYGVYLQVFTGSRALTFAQYEARRSAGQPGIIQVGYGPIADSPQDAFDRRFRGNHAIAETSNATYDPGADGRRPTVWRHDGRLYDRKLMRSAATHLVVATDAKGHPRFAGPDAVWCAFAPDVVPEYRVTIRPRKGVRRRAFNTYTVRGGVITGHQPDATGGFTATARIRCVPWPAKRANRYLVQLTSGSRKGQFVNASWAKEV